MTWPRAEPSSHAMSSAPSSTHLVCELRIHIVVSTGIFDLNGLHFIAVWIAIALTMHCHHGTDGNGVLLQADRSGAVRGRQRNFPNLAVRGHDLHGAVRAGE